MYSDPNKSAGAWKFAFFGQTLPDSGIVIALAVDNTNTVYAPYMLHQVVIL